VFPFTGDQTTELLEIHPKELLRVDAQDLDAFFEWHEVWFEQAINQ
jgi:hypothetical protein